MRRCRCVAFGTLVGATALVPYLVYLLTVLAYAMRRRRLRATAGAFSLGGAHVPVFVLSLIWLVGVVLALILPQEFRSADYVVLGALTLLALWYAVGLHWRLRAGTAGLAHSTGGAPPSHPPHRRPARPQLGRTADGVGQLGTQPARHPVRADTGA
ncbi:MAG: hypothetical protein ACRDRL_07105 [Sciscionella sp.]